MKGAEGYITRETSRRGGIVVRRTPESSSHEVSEEEKKNSSSDEARGQTFTPPLPLWWSCSPTILPDRWRSPHKGPVLGPTSLPNSLYWACWVWVRSHLQWRTPQTRTLQLAPFVGSCWCDNEMRELVKARPNPKGERWWPTYWAANGELPKGSQLNGRLAPCAWPSSPPGARRPANLTDGPR